MRIELRPYVACLPLFVAAVGCGGEERPPQAPSTPASEAPAAAASTASTERRIELIAPGQGDKRALRYVFHADHPETMLMTMDMSLVMQIGDKTVPESKLPRIDMTVSLQPKQVLPNGDLLFGFDFDAADVVEDPAVKPDVVKAMRDEMQKVVGLKGEGEVTPRGQTVRADMDIPAAIDPKLREMLEQIRSQVQDLSVPFPEEPIGPGAQWKAITPFFLGGIHGVRSITYTLGALEGDHGKLKFTVGVTAAPQDIEKKDLPEGTKLRLEEMRANGAGLVDANLQALVPRSKGRIEVTAVTSVEHGTDKAALTVTTKLDIAVAPSGK